MAGNLKCLYKDTGVDIISESIIGMGRADIEVRKKGHTIGIIESKLIKKDEDIKKKVMEGIVQLYARYSDNSQINNSWSTQLYLTLFSYDKEERRIHRVIIEAIKEYADQHGLLWDRVGQSSCNTIQVLLSEKSEYEHDNFFMKRQAILTIIICNMEFEYKKKQ